MEYEKLIYKEVELINKDVFWKLLSIDKRPVAVITGLSITPAKVNIGKLFVDPKFRNKKLASKLHTELVSWARETKHQKIEIELAPNKESGDLNELTAVIEHYGYKCYNPENKGEDTLLCYYLDL